MKKKLVGSALSLLLLCAALFFTACQTGGPDAANEALATELMDKALDVWNNGNMAAAEEMYSPDFTRTTPTGTVTGMDEFKAYYEAMTSAYSDVKLSFTDHWTKGDKVTVLWNFSATNTGPLGEDMPATGKAVSNDGVSILTLKDGKIVNDWALWDQLGAFTELGYTLQPPQMAEADAPAEDAAE
jgi:steroid delta-isomerase-like uncharacterized protein